MAWYAMASYAVAVSHVNGVAVSRRLVAGTASRRLAGVDITFAVQSASSEPAQVTALKNSFQASASDGSMVANVQVRTYARASFSCV